eukprot:CAMPEP_0197039372 /NCGR_PEP_ID=MMETSP1384-20130603/16168_1 /TAXON_ID=29189 /ORGANISM="Ammonia sp." /LENGTH=729 /DNA_ID=CAMNT_0042469957 /DNA_START=30 /DNA_END=2216 /DNA_ORIENTATION=-
MAERVSLSHSIDIDAMSFPDTINTNEEDVEESKVDCEESTAPNKKSAKWDWEADFVPLRGPIRVLHRSASYRQDTPDTDTVSSDIQTSSSRHQTQTFIDESQGIPPWISDDYPNSNFLDRLHMELIDFCMYVSPTKQEHAMRQELIERIKRIVLRIWPNAEIHVFGSMKTKLYLPTSDIDLAIYPNKYSKRKKQKANDSKLDYKTELAQELQREHMCSYLEIISTARVPLVKFTDSRTNLSVDICFDRESGVIAADEINTLQTKYPALRPLTYFLKYFLWYRNLHEPYRGGMGSYLLQMLIVNLLQTHPIRSTRRCMHVDSETTLGGWLMAFFELYGTNFNYSELGISPHPTARYFIKEDHGMKLYDRPYLLCCECPFESRPNKIMDAGRNTYNIMKIKQAFQWAHHTLLAKCDKPRKSMLSLLVGIRSAVLRTRTIHEEDKLIPFQATFSSDEEDDDEDDEDSNNEHEDDDDEDEDDDSPNSSFIALKSRQQNKSRSPCTSSDSSCNSDSSVPSSSSSSSYFMYNQSGELVSDVDSDEYYDATDFQLKHLFNADIFKNAAKTRKRKRKQHDEDSDLERKNIARLMGAADIDEEYDHNPYLNNHYKALGNKEKKRIYDALESNVDEDETPKLKRRKTMPVAMLHDMDSNLEHALHSKQRAASRSYSMPNLRKSRTPCIFYKKGYCKNGDQCSFQHGEHDQRVRDEDDYDEEEDGEEDTLPRQNMNRMCW